MRTLLLVAAALALTGCSRHEKPPPAAVSAKTQFVDKEETGVQKEKRVCDVLGKCPSEEQKENAPEVLGGSGKNPGTPGKKCNQLSGCSQQIQN